MGGIRTTAPGPGTRTARQAIPARRRWAHRGRQRGLETDGQNQAEASEAGDHGGKQNRRRRAGRLLNRLQNLSERFGSSLAARGSARLIDRIVRPLCSVFLFCPYVCRVIASVVLVFVRCSDRVLLRICVQESERILWLAAHVRCLSR